MVAAWLVDYKEGDVSQYQKTIMVKQLPELRTKVTNWAALRDVSVLDSVFQPTTMRFKGKKEYKSSRKFSVGMLFLWIAIGLGVGIAFSAGGSPGVGAVAWFVVPIGYVVYHFVLARAKTVEFEIVSVDSQEEAGVRVSCSDDFDDVKADVNALVTSLI